VILLLYVLFLTPHPVWLTKTQHLPDMLILCCHVDKTTNNLPEVVTFTEKRLQ